MFSQVSVCLHGGCLPHLPWADTPRETPPGQTTPRQTPPWADTPSGRHLPCPVHAGMWLTSGHKTFRRIFPQQTKWLFFKNKFTITRMHSSRMHSAHSSSHLLGGSASVHAGIHSPGPGPGTPPGVCLEHPPQGVGLESPLPDPQPPPHSGTGDPQTPLGCGPGDPPPWTEFLPHASEHITLPQLCFGW